MIDKLEKYIGHHKAGFDVYDPPAGLWTRIEQDLDKQPATKRSVIVPLQWRVAASVIALAGIAVFIWLMKPGANNTTLAGNDSQQINHNRAIAGLDTNNFMWADSNESIMATPELPVMHDSAKAAGTYDDSLQKYIHLIAAKQRQVALLKTEQPELYEQLAADLNDLGRSYDQLKAKLDSGATDEKIWKAALQNLRTQVGLLNRQLEISHQLQQQKPADAKNISSI